MAQGAGGPVARRTLVLTALGAVALPTAACGIRLEDDAPRLPLVPTRTPVPAEAALVALTSDTAALAEDAAALGGALGGTLAALHRRQYTVLRTTLAREQVPVAGGDAEPTTAPTSTVTATPTAGSSAGAATPTAGASPGAAPSPAGPSPNPRAALAADEGAAAASSGELAGVSQDLRATVAALHAQRYAAAALLAGRPPTVPAEPVDGPPVADLAEETSGAIWLLEVVSARSAGAQRKRSDTTLAALRALLADQVAGGARPEPALGHPLPFEVRTAADGARLAREVLGALRAGYGPHLEPLVTRSGPQGIAALTRWLGAVEVEAYRWGLGLEPFPGLE